MCQLWYLTAWGIWINFGLTYMYQTFDVNFRCFSSWKCKHKSKWRINEQLFYNISNIVYSISKWYSCQLLVWAVIVCIGISFSIGPGQPHVWTEYNNEPRNYILLIHSAPSTSFSCEDRPTAKKSFFHKLVLTSSTMYNCSKYNVHWNRGLIETIFILVMVHDT